MTWATRITLARLCSIPVLVALLYFYTPERESLRYAALVLYIAAAVSDYVDGYLARYRGQQSELGARLDPLADKLLVNLCFVFIAANPHFTPGVPLWFPPLLLLRDAWIIIAAAQILKRHGKIEAAARPIGKITTALMMITFLSALLMWQATPALVYASVAFGFISGGDYLLFGRHNLTAKEAR